MLFLSSTSGRFSASAVFIVYLTAWLLWVWILPDLSSTYHSTLVHTWTADAWSLDEWSTLRVRLHYKVLKRYILHYCALMLWYAVQFRKMCLIYCDTCDRITAGVYFPRNAIKWNTHSGLWDYIVCCTSNSASLYWAPTQAGCLNPIIRVLHNAVPFIMLWVNIHYILSSWIVDSSCSTSDNSSTALQWYLSSATTRAWNSFFCVITLCFSNSFEWICNVDLTNWLLVGSLFWLLLLGCEDGLRNFFWSLMTSCPS